MLTPYQIADFAEKYDGRANRVEINRLFRSQDESHLWPIRNRFNATDRAIRRMQSKERQGHDFGYGLEYSLSLDAEIAAIVNGDI